MGGIGFIGGGNMAEALIKGIIGAKLYKARKIYVSDISKQRLSYLAKEYKVKTFENNGEAAAADVVLLCVKPQNMTETLNSIKDSLGAKTLVISIAAGVKTGKICSVLGDRAVVRVMPNSPALIAEGAIALFANERGKEELEKAKKIFSAVGKVTIVDNEDLIDAVTAVSGSGPAYYFLLMEEMIKTAIRLGLDKETAKELVLQTAKGAALLASEAAEKGEEPQQLRNKVTSPGGTTQAALEVLASGKFSALIDDAIHRAWNRSKDLSK